jgi:hypothetical protein
MKYKKQEKTNKTLKKITKNNQKTKRNKSKKFGGSSNKSPLKKDPFSQKEPAIIDSESDDEKVAKKPKSNKPPYKYNNENSNLVIYGSNNLKNSSDNGRKSQSNLFVNHKTGGILLLVGLVGGLASVIIANQ